MDGIYKHGAETLDPRDKGLVSYNPDTKIFVTEASSLKGAGIEPGNHHFTIGGPKYFLFVWSERFQVYILYKHTNKVTDGDGDVIADVFKPHWEMITTNNQTKAMLAAKDTELHILND